MTIEARQQYSEITMIEASTLGYMLDRNEQLHVICMNGLCSHGAQLNIDWLADWLGRDHSCLADDII